MTSRSGDQLSQHRIAYQPTGCNLAYSFLSCNSFANFRFDLVDNRYVSARLKGYKTYLILGLITSYFCSLIELF